METKIGGKFQGISLDAFLQMAQMEGITCTLTVASGNKSGTLFLQEGALFSAETQELVNAEAAHLIISWENSVIELQNTCDKTVNEINQPLMNILMEGMRLRDEAKSAPSQKPTVDIDIEKEPPSSVREEVRETRNDSGEPSNETRTQKRPVWKYIIIILAVFLVVGGLVARFLISAKQNLVIHKNLLAKVAATDALEEKLMLLNTYVGKNPDNAYTAQINRQINTLLEQRAARDFEATESTAATHITDDAFEKAIAVYEAFRRKTPSSQYRTKAAVAIKTLSNRIESRNFETMKTSALAQGPERISVYQAFLEKHPEGKYREAVLGLIFGMQDEYFIYIERQILKHEKSENWQQCIKQGQHYMDLYPDSDHAEVLRTYLIKCREEINAAMSFKQLLQQADWLGTDEEAAIAVFSDFLKAYPKTPAKEKIEREIQKLSAASEEERLAEAVTRMTKKISDTGDRFLLENNETVTDTETGLMWCLIDSQSALNKCVTYEKAVAHVTSLNIGGHEDWRLPTIEELSALYDKQPSFPSDPKRWYWSSTSHKRYTGQWIIDVEIVAPNNIKKGEPLQKESWQCGAVRAVRRQTKK